jgi:hypothetical protein
MPPPPKKNANHSLKCINFFYFVFFTYEKNQKTKKKRYETLLAVQSLEMTDKRRTATDCGTKGDPGGFSAFQLGAFVRGWVAVAAWQWLWLWLWGWLWLWLWLAVVNSGVVFACRHAATASVCVHVCMRGWLAVCWPMRHPLPLPPPAHLNNPTTHSNTPRLHRHSVRHPVRHLTTATQPLPPTATLPLPLPLPFLPLPLPLPINHCQSTTATATLPPNHCQSTTATATLPLPRCHCHCHAATATAISATATATATATELR